MYEHLPAVVKAIIEMDDECEQKNKPLASSCAECGGPHCGINGHRRGSGYGAGSGFGGDSVKGLWTPKG